MGSRRNPKPKSVYEDVRKVCISENQARLASIGISRSLSSLRKPKNPPIVKKSVPKPDYSSIPLRRSGRVPGGKPEPESMKEENEEEEADAEEVEKQKKAPSAFFIFMEGFRKEYQEKHPDNKFVSAVGKAAGEKWRSMTDVEKAPFVAEHEKRKEEYKLQMDYQNKLAAGGHAKSDEWMPIKEEVEKLKKAPSAFFIFMEGFRKEYQEEHPDSKSVSAVGKAASLKWKSMTDAEKTPFVAEHEKRTEEYKLQMEAYKNTLAAGGHGKCDELMTIKEEV